MIRPHLFLIIAGDELAAEEHAARQVQLDDVVPDFVGRIDQRLRLVAAGVVEQHVAAAERLEHVGGQLLHGGAVVHVGDEVLDLDVEAVADFGLGLFQLVFVAGRDGDVRPAFGQAAGDRLADALAAAGDQGRAAGEVEEFLEHGLYNPG